jgi:hypothetical protein|tara:strand:- start:1272 stop:2432 length:1161 start_codon:yes stop_codon:yes gene_type:complete
MQDNRLLDFCESEAQRRLVEALIRSDGHRAAAAEALGISERGVYQALSRIKRKAAARGFAPDNDMTKVAAPGFLVKGVSTLYDVDGQQKAQWVKTTATADRDEHLREAITEAFEDWRGVGRIAAAPKHTTDEMLTVYPMGDPHLGLYGFAPEAGDNFDLRIAEQNLCEAVKRLVACSPKSQTCILLNLGDFFHSDSMDNRTSRSGHALDVDTRWSKVLRAGVRAMMTCIEAAAKKHEKVIVKNLIGNHDDHTSQMLGLALALFYEGNERVEIHDDPAKFWFHRFGQVLIGAGHGDTTKPAQLPGIMATDRAEDWGQTKHRYFYTGHIHTQNVAEYPGCVCESFRTLAARDAWAAAKGYRSGRDMYCIVHHKDHGEVERHRVDVAML